MNGKEKNFIGELRIMKDLDVKPNFSDLERKYGVDRHKLKKCYEEGKVPERKNRVFSSKWDNYYDEIVTLMAKTGTSKRAAYNFLENKYKTLPGTYSGFKSYTLRKGIAVIKSPPRPHVLYETDPGEQLQFDWKENVSLTLKDDTKVHFNVFSATLGYSRYHIFIFSYTKTTEDFLRCLIETFKRIGGTTKKVLTDNMSAVVSIKGNTKKILPIVTQFIKDLDIELKLAKVKTPQTKGKDENSNKFINWLNAYDKELESVEQLIDVIENVITRQANSQVNESTRVPPAILFSEEKEYLRPIQNANLINSYLKEHYRSIVPDTLLVYCRTKRYSVPQEYIGKYVDIYPINDAVYIYYNKNLIAVHTITQDMVNYEKNHYINALSTVIGSANPYEIEQMAERNLERLSKLGKKQ